MQPVLILGIIDYVVKKNGQEQTSKLTTQPKNTDDHHLLMTTGSLGLMVRGSDS